MDDHPGIVEGDPEAERAAHPGVEEVNRGIILVEVHSALMGLNLL